MTVTLVCPSCDTVTDQIWDGVCPACHYALNGGDQAPDELLIPTWEARLAVAE